MLRDLLPLASISTSIPSYQVSLSEVDPVTGGPAYMLSPSLPLGAISRLWGNQSLQLYLDFFLVQTHQFSATLTTLLPGLNQSGIVCLVLLQGLSPILSELIEMR